MLHILAAAAHVGVDLPAVGAATAVAVMATNLPLEAFATHGLIEVFLIL